MVHRRVATDPALEHEAFLRAPFEGRVAFWVGPVETSPGLGQATELSVGGLFLESDEVLTEGARPTVRFELAGRSITSAAEVVRVVKGGVLHAAGMGMRFVDLSADDSRAIIAYVVGSGRRP